MPSERDAEIARISDLEAALKLIMAYCSEAAEAHVRIAELEAVLAALVEAVEGQDDVLDPTADIVRAMRDAQSHLPKRK